MAEAKEMVTGFFPLGMGFQLSHCCSLLESQPCRLLSVRSWCYRERDLCLRLKSFQNYSLSFTHLCKSRFHLRLWSCWFQSPRGRCVDTAAEPSSFLIKCGGCGFSKGFGIAGSSPRSSLSELMALENLTEIPGLKGFQLLL